MHREKRTHGADADAAAAAEAGSGSEARAEPAGLESAATSQLFAGGFFTVAPGAHSSPDLAQPTRVPQDQPAPVPSYALACLAFLRFWRQIRIVKVSADQHLAREFAARLSLGSQPPHGGEEEEEEEEEERPAFGATPTATAAATSANASACPPPAQRPRIAADSRLVFPLGLTLLSPDDHRLVFTTDQELGLITSVCSTVADMHTAHIEHAPGPGPCPCIVPMPVEMFGTAYDAACAKPVLDRADFLRLCQLARRNKDTDGALFRAYAQLPAPDRAPLASAIASTGRIFGGAAHAQIKAWLTACAAYTGTITPEINNILRPLGQGPFSLALVRDLVTTHGPRGAHEYLQSRAGSAMPAMASYLDMCGHPLLRKATGPQDGDESLDNIPGPVVPDLVVAAASLGMHHTVLEALAIRMMRPCSIEESCAVLSSISIILPRLMHVNKVAVFPHMRTAVDVLGLALRHLLIDVLRSLVLDGVSPRSLSRKALDATCLGVAAAYLRGSLPRCELRRAVGLQPIVPLVTQRVDGWWAVPARPGEFCMPPVPLLALLVDEWLCYLLTRLPPLDYVDTRGMYVPIPVLERFLDYHHTRPFLKELYLSEPFPMLWGHWVIHNTEARPKRNAPWYDTSVRTADARFLYRNAPYQPQFPNVHTLVVDLEVRLFQSFPMPSDSQRAAQERLLAKSGYRYTAAAPQWWLFRPCFMHTCPNARTLIWRGWTPIPYGLFGEQLAGMGATLRTLRIDGAREFLYRRGAAPPVSELTSVGGHRSACRLRRLEITDTELAQHDLDYIFTHFGNIRRLVIRSGIGGLGRREAGLIDMRALTYQLLRTELSHLRYLGLRFRLLTNPDSEHPELVAQNLWAALRRHPSLEVVDLRNSTFETGSLRPPSRLRRAIHSVMSAPDSEDEYWPEGEADYAEDEDSIERAERNRLLHSSAHFLPPDADEDGEEEEEEEGDDDDDDANSNSSSSSSSNSMADIGRVSLSGTSSLAPRVSPYIRILL